MQMKLETITPRKAADWLKLNVNNRPLSESYVKQLADSMADGQWQVNGDPIRFDGAGGLTDGQHRLTAIIKSGASVQSWVLRGLDAKAFDTIDRGHKRSNGDILARRGENNYNMLAAAVNVIWSYFGAGTRGNVLRPDQMDKILAIHGDQLRKACSFAAHYKPQSQIITTSELAGSFAWIDFLYGDGIGEAFWKPILENDGLKPGTAQHTLFKRLVEQHVKAGTVKLTKRARIGLCVKAINAWITNQPLKRLSFDVDREAFPEFVTGGAVARAMKKKANA